MAKEKATLPRLSQGELEIMGIVWGKGEATGREIHEALPRSIAYTTLRTYLDRLVQKGYLKVNKPEGGGRSFVYTPTVERKWERNRRVEELRKRLSMKPADFVAHFVERGELTDEDEAAIRRLLGEKE